MLTIKGFCARARQADNTPGVTAVFGELSTYVRTFSKDIRQFANVSNPEIEINVFSTKVDGVKTDTLSTVYAEGMIKVSAWIYDKSIAVNQNTTQSDYLLDILNQFHGQIENPTVGPIKYAAGRTMPEWIQFKLSGTPSDNTIKLWFSAVAMERDYDEYEITIVPPVANVDTFFLPIADIRSALALTSPSDLIEKVQLKRNKQPETVLKAEVVQYMHPNDPSIKIDTTWYALVHGPAGNNSESIKQAMIDFILANSKEPETAWKLIFPYLFKLTRMFIFPQWESMALPNRVTQVGIYSPIVSVQSALQKTKLALNHLDTTFVDTNVQVTHHKWRSIALVACGSSDNVQNKFKLTDYIGDYIAESATSLDFNRMSEPSKAWTVAIEEMLILAENMAAVDSLPIHIRRTVVGDTAYIGRTLNKVEYLVAIKRDV